MRVSVHTCKDGHQNARAGASKAISSPADPLLHPQYQLHLRVLYFPRSIGDSLSDTGQGTSWGKLSLYYLQLQKINE